MRSSASAVAVALAFLPLLAHATCDTTTTTSVTCPTVTSTTLGIPDCGQFGACFGLCSNARACVPDAAGHCGCTGPELPCNAVTYNGMCGGTCPEGETCSVYSPTLPNGCPDYPRCACVPMP